MIKLWDLAGHEDHKRFSPYCWCIKMVIKHKRLELTTIPWRFTEKEEIAFSGQTLVPVIQDGDRVVNDTWKIAEYLEQTYQQADALWGNEVAKGLSLFSKIWIEQTIFPLIFKLIAKDVYRALHPKDKDFFQALVLSRTGFTVDQYSDTSPSAIKNFRDALEPVRTTLENQPYLSGSHPSFTDYLLFGVFKWGEVVSDIPLLEETDPLYEWRRRISERFPNLQ